MTSRTTEQQGVEGNGISVFDKRGISIERGDIVKVLHFIGARRKRHYMYKQCLGVGSYRPGKQQYVFFSHLNFNNEIGSFGSDAPYHEWPGTHLSHYEIVDSLRCDHEDRPRHKPQLPEDVECNP